MIDSFPPGAAWEEKSLVKGVEEGELISHRDPSATRFAGGIKAALALACLALVSCRQPAAGAPKPTAPHPTIVSLNPCSDAILAQITQPGQLIAVSHYSHDPASSSMGVAAASRYRAVSGSVEEIAQLAPDMVVADIYLPPTTAQAIRDLGMRLVSIGTVNSVAASEAQIRELAAETKKSLAGEQLIGEIEHALATGAAPSGQVPASAIVWESGGIVAGDQTLIADLLRRTGFVNAAAARGLGQADYLPLEAMLADPPDVILATGSAQSQEDRLLAHPALAALAHTPRVPLDGALLWCGGPTIVRAVGELARIRRSLPAATRAKSAT
jgi:iron complex transport system substrate-binding protein